MTEEIAVIGAGVVGVSIALELARRGHEVTLIDRAGVAAEASRGNAGAFAFSDIIPLATPGVVTKAPKWLLDPTGPLSVPPAYFPRLLPWLVRFWRASWRDRYAASVSAQAALMGRSSDALERLVTRHGLERVLRREGQLKLYESAAAYRADAHERAAQAAHGVRTVPVEGLGALAEIQPGLSDRFTHGTFAPDWLNVTDPALWTERLAELLVQAGGTIRTAAVTALERGPAGVTLRTDGADITARRVVVAAGAWSHHLSRTLGDRLPLETERGYNTTLPMGAADVRTQLTFAAHGFVVSRIGDRVRVGGAVELGGLDRPPDMRRAEVMLDKARGFLPTLGSEAGEQWMGFRPSMPDSLPVIGPAPGAAEVIYAFGHGHLGLTQSAGTAELVADLVDGREPGLDLAPFRPGRF